MEILTEPAKKYVDSDIKFKVKLPAYETRRVEGTFLDEEGTKQDGKTLITYKGNTSQNGTPTPSSPIDVNVVTGYNKVVVSNKNLLDLSKSEIGAIDSSGNAVSNNQNWRATDFIPVKSNTTYTYSRDYTGTYTALRLYEYDKNFNFISPRTQVTTATNTITTKSNTRYLKWTIYQNITIMTIDIVKSLNLQIEAGSRRTDYIQHQGQEYEVNLGTIELCKIGTYQDRIYRQNAKWYIHKEVEKKVLNGSEDWTIANTGTPNWYYSRIDNTINIINDSTINNSICDYYPFGSVGNSNTNQGYYIVKNTKQIRIRYGTEDTITNFKTWLSSNNVTLYYVSSTPTDTEITNQALISQLEYIKNNLKTYEEETIISQVNSDLPFYLDVLMEI